MKSFAFGLRRFLRERVNRLDLCIVLFAILEICLTSAGGLGAIRSLRILRAIRPLRALTKSPGMRMVLKSVALSVGAMANVSAVLLLVFVVFGILGVQIFAGRFYRCDDPTVPNKRRASGRTCIQSPASRFNGPGRTPTSTSTACLTRWCRCSSRPLWTGTNSCSTAWSATGVGRQQPSATNPGRFLFPRLHRAVRLRPAQPVRGRDFLPVLADPHAEPDQLAGPDRSSEGVGGDVQNGAAHAPAQENAAPREPVTAYSVSRRVARKV